MRQTSRGKFDRLQRTTVGFTNTRLDGYGLCCSMPTRPPVLASYPILVHRHTPLLHASFRPRLATTPLRFANPSPPSGWIRGLHPQTVEHARHTLTPGPKRQAWKSLRDSQNRRPAATGQRNRGFTKVSDQVCWRTERWHNGRTRHPRNLSCGKVLRGCESSQEKSAAHPIKDTSFGSIKDRIHLRRLNRHLHFSLATTRRTIHSGAPVICPEPGSLADVG